MKKLPKVLYVSIMDKGTEDEYLYCSDNVDDELFEDGDLIGAYRQTELLKLEIKRETQPVIRRRPKRS